MPFTSNAELPVRIRKYLPRRAQDIFRAAFNNAYERNGPNAVANSLQTRRGPAPEMRV